VRAPTRTLFAGALLATSLAFAAMPSNPASAATSTIRVSIIGDESLTGLEDANKPTRDTITATYPMALDAACNRKTAVPQAPADFCNVGKVTTAAEVINGTTGGDLGEVLVMMTGYNDFPGVAPNGFAADVDAIMAAATAQGVQRVVWLNLRLEGATPLQTTKWTANNATLAAKDAQYPNLVVANWNAASTGQSALFLASPEQYKIRTNQAGFLATFLKTTIDGNVAGITPPAPAPGAPSGSRCLAANAGGIVSASPSPQAFSSDGKGSNYIPITPARLLDTRAGDADQVNRAIGQGRLVRVDFSDRAPGAGLPNGIPANATAVTLNVTAVDPCNNGFVTVFPCGPGGPPLSSTVNFKTGQIVPNAVTVKLGSFNRVCFFSQVQSDLVVDVAGFYSDAAGVGSGHTAAAPLRLLDTRPGLPAVNPHKGKIAGTTDFPLQVAGVGTVPPGATGVVLNVTAVEPAGDGFITVYPGPCGAANRPFVSNLNFRGGQVVPNSVAVKVGTGGVVCIYSNVTTDLVVDFNASFGTGTALRSATPLRVIDTRAAEPAALAIKGKTSSFVPVTVPVTSAVPGGAAGAADGVLLNVTATEPAADGFLTVYPCGTTPPTVSNVNFKAGDTRPNLVDVKLGTGQSVCVTSNTSTHVIVDLLGWYQA
jgi:hypothetical protein